MMLQGQQSKSEIYPNNPMGHTDDTLGGKVTVTTDPSLGNNTNPPQLSPVQHSLRLETVHLTSPCPVKELLQNVNFGTPLGEAKTCLGRPCKEINSKCQFCNIGVA